jgi:hypothetical protein
MMQCVVKSKTVCGSPIFVHFLAPVNTKIPDSVIDYSHDHFPSDQKLAHSEDDYHYALKQCFILAKYLQKYRGMEILQMKAEFFKDENGFIWLFYIKNIHMRKSLHIEGLLAGTLTAADVKKH